MPPAVPLSRPVTVAGIPDHGLEEVIKASPAEEAAIAKTLNLISVAAFEARLTVARAGKDGAHVTGTVTARVEQACVVSLEPFMEDITAPVDIHFTAAPIAPPRAGTEEGDSLEALDAPDPIEDGRIDLGQVATEFLALALDPYPRKPGAVFAPDVAEAQRPTPFAVLERLKSRKP